MTFVDGKKLVVTSVVLVVHIRTGSRDVSIGILIRQWARRQRDSGAIPIGQEIGLFSKIFGPILLESV